MGVRYDSNRWLLRRNDPVREPYSIGFVCVNGLPGDDHLDRFGLSNQPRQPLRCAHAWEKAHVDFGQSKSSFGGDKAESTGECELQVEAEGIAVHGGDGEFSRLIDQVERLPAAILEGPTP
jgi:hypothetical protein